MKEDLDLKTPDDVTISFFNKRAKDTAEELTPGLFIDLYHELHCGPLPTELAVILWRRLYYEVFEFCCMVLFLKKTPGLQNNFFAFLQDIEWVEKGPGYNPVVKSVYNAFKRELEEYKKKHKEDLSQTITKAKGGDRKALFNMVKWDKTWLQFDFVQKNIMDAQYKNDSLFFERLADAIRKKSGVKKNAKEERIFKIVNLMVRRFDISEGREFKEFHEDLDKAGVFDKDEVSNLCDFKYFMKQLRRHRII